MLVWVMTPNRQRLMKSITVLIWVMTPNRQRSRDGESASSPASVSLSARPTLWRRRVRGVGLVLKPLSGVCWPQRCRPAFFFSLFEVITYLCCCCNCVICLRHYQKRSGITFWMTRLKNKNKSFVAVVLLWLLWILPRNPLLRGMGHSLCSSSRSCPPTRSAPSERFGYWSNSKHWGYDILPSTTPRS